MLIFRCCYDTQNSLLGVDPWSVALVDGKSVVFRSDDGDDLEHIYKACCSLDYLDSGLTPKSMCTKFIEYRPPCASNEYKAFSK